MSQDQLFFFGENVIEVTQEPISPELLVAKVKTDSSGCIVTYIRLIREYSRGKPVLSVEYQDPLAT